MNTYTLSNGFEIPVIGYGTWQNEDPKECIRGVKDALAVGFRHIDCARAYANEDLVGQGIRESGVPREEIFLTGKLRNAAHGYENVLREVETTLKDLGTDYLDLYLIHWPVVKGHKSDWKEDNIETWRAFEKLYEEGKLKAIGVSNFSREHLENLLENAKIKPMVNQILIHPGVLLDEDMAFCRENGILLEGYSPLSPIHTLSEEETFKEILRNHGKTPAQVLLRFVLELGALPLTKTIHRSRMEENIDVLDFSLTEKEMDYLKSWSHPDFSPRDNVNERPPQKLDEVLAGK
ncbi:aldo/keto reductase [Proteiniclasticum sp. SCR006]|uniref:Aldo/keto reductase n=1 Tax=Proteiniclasticum aestuarii TaxID=2817862 RepID=A0A939KFQ6_9CLOT|nr:aldo/keto reductase [Proteiniclasticum aestuarii]MBO1264702.1 aldo/keto reductase [Proteiniclasticum aestuarii]